MENRKFDSDGRSYKYGFTVTRADETQIGEQLALCAEDASGLVRLGFNVGTAASPVWETVDHYFLQGVMQPISADAVYLTGTTPAVITAWR